MGLWTEAKGNPPIITIEGFFLFLKSYLACLELNPMNEFTVEKPKGLFDLSAILQNHVTPDTRPSFALYSSLAAAAQHC